jgi:hypothetical protein
MGRYLGSLGTDAYTGEVEEMKLGRYHVAACPQKDTDAVMAAVKRVKTTAWVASYATLTCSTNDTITMTAPMMMGGTPNDKVKFVLATSQTDVMSVAAGTGATADTVTITLAKTSASNNTAAKIQVAIRALGTVNGIDVSGITCTGSAQWDANAVAKADDTAVAMANGVTGDYDEYTTGFTNPGVPRTITATSGGTANDIGAVAVYIYGTDYQDNAIEEELPYFTANSATTVESTRAYKTITKVMLPVHDGAAATTSIGFGNGIGLPYLLDHTVGMKLAIGGTEDANAPTYNIDADEISKNYVAINALTTLDGVKDVDIYMWI